jgi:tetratricopeptide (TPR) repeat protein
MDLARFALRTLDAATREVVEAHVDKCADCRAASSALVTVSRGESEPADAGPRPRVTTGEQIGRFVTLHELGEGAASVVYAAYDPDLDRNVALKLLRPRSGLEERLLREGRALARLSHPNVVAVYEVGSASGRLYIALELVDGVTARQWIAFARRSWREVRDVFVAAGRGVAALHRAGLVHRDVKPDNIIVASDRVRIVDFGLVGAGARAGTPAYMAPEVKGGRVDERSDQYALCAAFADCLGGLRAIEDPAGLAVPARLRAAIARGLERDPARRFPSIDAWIAAVSDRKARRAAIPAAIALGLVGAGAVVAATSGTPADVCDGISSPWTGLERSAVDRVLVGAGVPYAAATRDRVMRRLDTFAGSWRDEREQVCRLYRERGEISADRFDRRVTCLERERIAFAAAYERLAAGHRGALDRAIDIAAGLPTLDECRDDAGLERREQLPADQQLRAQVTAIESELASATISQRAGDPRGALVQARHALAAARRVGFAPVVASTEYEVADLLERAGDAKGAAALIDEVVQTAAAARLDVVEAKGWILRLYLRGVDEAAGDAELQAAVGAGTAAAARARDPVLHAHLTNVLGLIAKNRGDYAHAREHFEAALAELKTARHDGPEVAATLGNLSVVRARLGDLAGARDAADECARRDREMFGEQHPTYADSLIALAAREGQTGERERAIEHLNQALAIEVAAFGDTSAPAMIIHQNLANQLAESGKLEDAMPHAERALALVEQLRGHDSPDVAVALLTVANIAAEKRDLARATEIGERALAITQKAHGADHPMAAAIEADLGEWALRAGDAATAEKRLRAALAAMVNTPESPDVATIRTSLGEALLAQGRRAQAIEQLEPALALREKIGDTPLAIADTRFTLARALWSTARRAEALPLARAAAAVFEKAGPDAAPYRKELAGWLAAEHVRL